MVTPGSADEVQVDDTHTILQNQGGCFLISVNLFVLANDSGQWFWLMILAHDSD